jgi:peptide/nickel transport system permease protein
MTGFVLRRLAAAAATMLALTFIVFALVNLEPNLRKLALEQTNARASPEAVERWLADNGYREPLIARYGAWIARVAQGDFGQSTRFRAPVAEVLGERLGYTATLGFWVLAVMVPTALAVGVLAGMREGSRLDRGLSTVSILSSATPEYVSGILFTVIFASQLGWLKGVAQAGAPSFETLALPVMTMAFYGMGYIARMTRASMAEAMTAQYVRTARLKGLSFAAVVWRHALRNALIAPFTVIMLQFPWLLTGVVIVETLFNYKGFGWTLVEAADNNDIDLLLACSLASVAVVLATQALSDLGYAALNPRIRVR